MEMRGQSNETTDTGNQKILPIGLGGRQSVSLSALVKKTSFGSSALISFHLHQLFDHGAGRRRTGRVFDRYPAAVGRRRGFGKTYRSNSGVGVFCTVYEDSGCLYC